MPTSHARMGRLLAIFLMFFATGARLLAKDRPEPHPEPIMESDQPDAAKHAVTLPLLKEGPGKGYYVYFKGRHYEAMVDGNGALLIYLLDDKDKRLEKKPWPMHGGISTWWSKLVGYNPKNDRPIVKTFVRRMKEIKEASDPTDEPRRTIEVKAVLMDDVKFVRRYEFDRDGVKVWSGYDCPNDEHRSRYRSGVSFAACKKFAPNVEQPEREKELKGYEVELKGPSGKKKHDTQKIPYSESENFRIGRALEVSAVGPWGSRVVHVKADDPILHPQKYNGRCPYQGFGIYYDLGNGTDKSSKQAKIEFEFE